MTPTSRATTMLLTGAHAIAWAACLARPHVIPVYPITPQTPVLEKLAELAESGALGGDLMTVESEHTAMAACIAASTAGARVFTATASQGLALMHEMLHYAAGARAPVVMANVNRTLASPWGFWADQTDSLAQRDTGWIQLYCASAQEALDTVLLAYRVAEAVRLPAMIVIEALYVSHTLEPVDVPAAEVVDAWLDPFTPDVRLDPKAPRGFGGTATPAQWREHRLAMQAAMDRVPQVLATASLAWAAVTGRSHRAIESYRMEDAEIALVTMGSIGGTARVAVDALRDEGLAVGVVRVRLFRPFPVRELADAVAGVDRIAVIDRNCSIGSGGIVASELRAGLSACDETDAPVFSYIAGLGGVDVPVERIVTIAHDVRHRRPGAPGPILEEALTRNGG